MLPCFPCSSPWESNVFPHTKGGSSEICQESGECVCWTCEETSLGGFGDNGAWAPAVVYFVHAKHFTRTRGNSRSEQRHNISLSYWKGLFHLCHPISGMIAPRELCLTNRFSVLSLHILQLQALIFLSRFFQKLNLVFIGVIVIRKWRSHHLTNKKGQVGISFAYHRCEVTSRPLLEWNEWMNDLSFCSHVSFKHVCPWLLELATAQLRLYRSTGGGGGWLLLTGANVRVGAGLQYVHACC